MATDLYNNRRTVIIAFFALACLVLVVKAFFLQVVDSTYRERATGIDKYTVYPSRGLVYDRNDKLLVYNDPIYDLMVTVSQMDSKMDTLKFCRLLGIEKADFKERLNKDFRSGRFSRAVPFVFLSKISPEICARFRENLFEYPGFFLQLRNVRGYPYASSSHILGYIREVNDQEVKNSGGLYIAGDYIGASGLEASYENALRGRKGAKYILKDNLGREVGSYKEGEQDTLPISGKDLIATIDIELQRYGESLMVNKLGSIVAIEPATGEILSMVSSPYYDPNLLTIGRERGKAFQMLQQDTLQPLFDRTVQAQYPPGSLFKPIVALIGLQTGVLHPNRTIGCSGGYILNGQRLTGCHGHPTATSVQMGIQHSCNAYFVQTFRDIVDQYGYYNPAQGLDTFAHYLSDFGLGHPLGIDYPYEKRGNVAGPTYYDKLYGGERWKSVYIRSVGIGQGEMLLTNIQMANLAAILANRGWYYTPHLVKGFRNDDDQIEEAYRTRHSVRIDPQHFTPVVDGMEQVVLAGTARVANIPDIPVCGKTGTAENPHGEDHSIFFAFAPKDNPKIAIAVYVENAGFGATYAAPIASLMIEKYLKGQISPGRKYLEDRMLQMNLVARGRQALP